MPKKLIAAMVLFSLGVAALWYFASASGETPVAGFPAPAYPIGKRIRFAYTVQNTTAQVVDHARLWVRAPVKQTATQQCAQVDASQPFTLLTDELGNQVLLFHLEKMPPFASRVIEIRAGIRLSEKANPLPDPGLSGCLEPEPFIQSDAPPLMAAAAGLKRPDPLQTAAACYAWVRQNVSFTGYSARERGALFALNHKEGDCTEFADLFVALCRAGGIPARAVGGYICREGRSPLPSGYHNWAVFYAGGLWHLSDPQKGNFMANHPDYVATRIIAPVGSPELRFDRHRIEGKGLKVFMHDR